MRFWSTAANRALPSSHNRGKLSHPLLLPHRQKLQPNYFKPRLLDERDEFTSAELVQPSRAQISAVPTALTGAHLGQYRL